MLGSDFGYFSENGSYRTPAIEECFNHIKGKASDSSVDYIHPSCIYAVVTEAAQLPTFSQRRRLEYIKAPRLFLPLCYGEPGHWYLFWVEEDNVLRCVDGKNGQCLSKSELSNVSRRIVEWLSMLGKDVYYDSRVILPRFNRHPYAAIFR